MPCSDIDNVPLATLEAPPPTGSANPQRTPNGGMPFTKNSRSGSGLLSHSAAGASVASPGPLGSVVRRSTPHGALGLRFLAITHPQLTEQGAAPHGSGRSRKVELYPLRASLEVGTAPTPCEQVKVEERLVVRVEDARPFLDDPGPRPQVGEQVGEVIEQLRRTVRHGSVFRPLRKASSAQPDLSARATSCALSASARSARAPTSCASRDRSRARARSPRRQPYAWRLEMLRRSDALL